MVYELYPQRTVNKKVLRMIHGVQGITHSKTLYIKTYKLKQNKKRKKENEARTKKKNYYVKVKS